MTSAATACRHWRMVDPPPGKHLRVCLDCVKHIIECSNCDATITAGPHIVDSGWMESGQGKDRWVHCPACWNARR